MGCVEIEVRPDQTFTYRLFGHLLSDTVEGHWRSVGDGIVVASSVAPPELKPPTPLSLGGQRFTIRVEDELANSIPGAKVTVTCDGLSQTAVADANGLVDVNPCNQETVELTVELDSFRTSNFEVSTAATGYAVELSVPSIEIDEELWYILDEELLVLRHLPIPRAAEPSI